MRTTLTLDDTLVSLLKEKSLKSGKSFKRVVNETIKMGLLAEKTIRPRTQYRLKTVSMGGVHSGINLTKALQLADQLEDDAIHGELELRK